LQQALELQRELGYEGVVAYRHMSIGWNCLNSGEFERARQCFDECLALFLAFGNHNGVHRSLTSLGWLAVRVADWAAASARFEEALSVAGGLGDQVAIADALFHLGSFAMHQGEFEAAAGYLRESADQWRTVGNRAGLCWAVNELSSAYRFSCQFDKAYAQVEDSLSIAREMDAPWLRHVATAYRAWLDVTVGRYDTAQTYAQESIAQYPGGTSHTHLDIAQAALGWTALSTKDYEGAERVLKESIANARAVTNRVSEAWSLTALGGVAFGLGRREEAHALLLEALELLIESRAFAMLLHLLPIVTVVLADDDDVDKKVRAAELYGLCISHPFLARAQLFEDVAWRQVREAMACLPPDVFAAAQERGRALDWWETAEALLTELDW
jgi:tetratricopeptide (TPR) repeat protein